MDSPPDNELNQSAANDFLSNVEIMRRFAALEAKIDATAAASVAVSSKLAHDMLALAAEVKNVQQNTSDLVDMWKDATAFFSAMRRVGKVIRWVGNLVVWISGVLIAMAGIYIAFRSDDFWKFWSNK